LETQTYKPLDARIQHALDLIHHGLQRQLAVSELARQVGLSDSHFHHLFRREIGVSPAKYLDNLMLREAEHLIKSTALSVKDIFSIVGVADRSHFIRKFRQVYGLSPSRYRIRKAGWDVNSGDGSHPPD
jgi:AraC family transcriptional regulator